MAQPWLYIIRRPNSPYWYIQLPGHRPRSTKIAAEHPDPKQQRANEQRVQTIRDRALRGEPEFLHLLGLDSLTPITHVVTGPTLGEWIAVWKAQFQSQHQPSSISGNRPRVEYWDYLWGTRLLASLTRQDIQTWQTAFQQGDPTLCVNGEGRTLSRTNANTHMYIATLRLIVKDALGWKAAKGGDGIWRMASSHDRHATWWLPDPHQPDGAAVTHCCMGLEPLKLTAHAKGKHLTIEELQRLYPASREEAHGFPVLLLFGTQTGQRLSNLLDVKRSDVRPRVRHHAHEPAAMVTFRRTKNGKPFTMPIFEQLTTALANLPVDPRAPEYLFGELRSMTWWRQWVTDAMRRTCTRAGVDYMRWHWATRATAAMRLHEAGYSSFEIMKLLNWESEGMVKRYIPETAAGLADAGGQILARIAPESSEASEPSGPLARPAFANRLQVVANR